MKTLQLTLTTSEWNVITTIINQVNEHLTWDNENRWYEDTGDIMLTFNTKEKKALTRVSNKLMATAVRSDERLRESSATEKEKVEALKAQVRAVFQGMDR